MEYLCPTCQAVVVWRAENPFRPFCSERCRLIDLGAWADESRGLPVDPEHLEGEALEQLFSGDWER